MKPKSAFPLLVFFWASALTVKAQTFTSIDINPGADSSLPNDFVTFNSKLIFAATTATSGSEPFISDGTPSGTTMIADIWPGTGSSNPYGFTVWNSRVYFAANDSVHGYQVWSTDGTTPGTSLLKIIQPASSYELPGKFTPFNGKLYFAGTDSLHGTELWVTDGTAGGTTLLKDIWPGQGSSSPGNYGGIVVMGSKFYFDANDSVHGTELWESDGTTAGTQMVLDIWPGSGSSYPGEYGGFFAFNNQLYFSANDGIHGYELWVSDSAASGTSLVKDIWPGPGSSQAGYADYGPGAPNQWAEEGFTAYNSKFYFEANDSMHGFELWSSDGTAGGTNMVADIYPGDSGSYAGFEPPVVYNGLLYVPARGNGNNYQIWVSDGTTGGTHVATNINPHGTPYPHGLLVQGNLIYFIDVDSILDNEAYSTDGTDTGTHMIIPAIAPNINPLGYGNEFEYLNPFNSSIAYAASYNNIGYELWIYTPPAAAIGSVNNLPSLQVYPNPFNEQLMLQGLTDGTLYDVNVSNIEGQTVTAQHLTGTGNATTLDLQDITPGIYLLRLSNANNAITVKVVKQ